MGRNSEFTWDDVKVDKHRENYLGHSIKAPVGRWQKVINGARRASPAENGAGLCHGGGKARLLQESGRSPVFCKDEVVAEGGYRVEYAREGCAVLGLWWRRRSGTSAAAATAAQN
ncbi:UNVERIFIED_CONTAM: Multiple myeloma tumor-associated protein 2 [Sesamum calycinum]|uniref:Multiple myeloma tumor-associated protein 2 n=1 Tax=Sesamum calycinum TaxID=2727403 RepID=A0AAW2LU38_9LAMI